MKEDINEFSMNELEEFIQHRVWKAIVKDSIDQMNAKMEENNDIDPFKDPTTICRNQGFMRGIGHIVDFPAILREQVEYERKMKKEEKKDE